MMVVDTSVVVAAFASWHEQHQAARNVLDAGARLIDHCALESYSVLTRLPPPHRSPAPVVRDFLRARFPPPYLRLDARRFQEFVLGLVDKGITGVRSTMRWWLPRRPPPRSTSSPATAALPACDTCGIRFGSSAEAGCRNPACDPDTVLLAVISCAISMCTAMLRSLRSARRQRLVAARFERSWCASVARSHRFERRHRLVSRTLGAGSPGGEAWCPEPTIRNTSAASTETCPRVPRTELAHGALTEEELHSLPSLNHRVAGALTVALDLSHELAWLVEVDLLVRHRAVFKMPRW